MECSLKRLSPCDGVDIYEMLQRLPEEHHFSNPVRQMGFAQYEEWLKEQDRWSRGEGLPTGYVPQTIFWLYVDGKPAGMGKIRHELNEASRRIGGNIGYAIDPLMRGRGLGKEILRQLLAKASEMKIGEVLLTIDKDNPSSRAVAESNGCYVVSENEERWFLTANKATAGNANV